MKIKTPSILTSSDVLQNRSSFPLILNKPGTIWDGFCISSSETKSCLSRRDKDEGEEKTREKKIKKPKQQKKIKEDFEEDDEGEEWEEVKSSHTTVCEGALCVGG